MTSTTPVASRDETTTKGPNHMGPFTSEALAMLVAEDWYRAHARPDHGHPLHVLRSSTGTYYVSPVAHAFDYAPVTTYANAGWAQSAGSI